MSDELATARAKRPLSRRAIALALVVLRRAGGPGVLVRPGSRGELVADMGRQLGGERIDRNALNRAAHELQAAELMKIEEPTFARQPAGYTLTAAGADLGGSRRATATSGEPPVSHGEPLVQKKEESQKAEEHREKEQQASKAGETPGESPGEPPSPAPIDLEEAARLIEATARFLRSLAPGAAHRDVKPANVLGARSDRPMARRNREGSPPAKPSTGDPGARLDLVGLALDVNRPAAGADAVKAVLRAIALEPVDAETAKACARVALDKPEEDITNTRPAFGRWLAQGNLEPDERASALAAQDAAAPVVVLSEADQARVRALQTKAENARRANREEEAKALEAEAARLRSGAA